MIRLAIAMLLLPASVARAQDASDDGVRKAAVIGFKATGLEDDVATNLVDLFTAEAGKIPGYKIIGQSEIQDTVGFAAQQKMLGCEDDAKCITDFAGALGADLLVTGRVGKVGETFVVSMQLIDVQKKEAVNRTGETIAGRVDVLLYYVRLAAWQLFSLEPPDDVVKKYQAHLESDQTATTEVVATGSGTPPPAASQPPTAGPTSQPNGPLWAITVRKAFTAVAALGILGGGALTGLSYWKQSSIGDPSDDIANRDVYEAPQTDGRSAESFQKWSIVAYSVGVVGVIGAIVFKIMEPDNVPAGSAASSIITPTPGGFAVRF